MHVDPRRDSLAIHAMVIAWSSPSLPIAPAVTGCVPASDGPVDVRGEPRPIDDGGGDGGRVRVRAA